LNIIKFSSNSFTLITPSRLSIYHKKQYAIFRFLERHPQLRFKVLDPSSFLKTKLGLPKFDVVHLHGSPWWPEFYDLPKSRKAKIAHTIHNFYMEDDATTEWQQQMQLWSNALAIKSYRNSDVVISVAKWVQQLLLEKYKIKATHIPNGIDPKEFENGNPDRFRVKYGIENEFLLFAGRVEKYKRPELYIDLAKRMPDKFFIMTGLGVTEDNLQTYLQEKPPDNVRCLDVLPREDFIDAMSGCKAFVLPSKNETFGILILEAMSCGRTVVASNSCGPPEIIEDGVDGFLFEPDNPNNLYEKACKALEHPEVGKKGYEKAIENYNWEGIVRRTDKVYEDIIN
jgi:glycosyltransferase involved in cell wall biosynthesis